MKHFFEFQTPLRYTKTLLLPVVLVVFVVIIRKVSLSFTLWVFYHTKTFSYFFIVVTYTRRHVNLIQYDLLKHSLCFLTNGLWWIFINLKNVVLVTNINLRKGHLHFDSHVFWKIGSERSYWPTYNCFCLCKLLLTFNFYVIFY